MNKEPLGLYIFRFIIGFGMLAFMAMLYWSSALLETDMKELTAQVGQLKSDITAITTDLKKIQSSTIETRIEYSTDQPSSLTNSSKSLTLRDRPYIDSSLPNLMHEDPLYTKILPKLLGSNFERKGVFHTAVLGKPNNLHPFSNWLNIATWVSQCNPSVAKLEFGKYETFTPDMAIKVEERTNKETGTSEYWVHLRDGVYWQPLQSDFFSEDLHLSPHFLKKHQVTADDFKFYYDALMNPYNQESGAIAARNYFVDIAELKVIDQLTFTVRWKTEDVNDNGRIVPKTRYVAKQLTGSLRPLASFVYKYFPDGKKIIEEDSSPDTYRTNSVWAQNFAQHWAKNIIPSCGPWMFMGMTERQIKFKRNPDYYFPNAILVEGEEVEFKDSPDTIWQDFKANKLDSYTIRPEQQLELEEFLKSPQYLEQKKAGAGINRLEYLARRYQYIGWNQAKPFFKSKKVRQALTMAIDRQRIIKQILNGMGEEITGTFYLYSSAYDKSISPWPFDPQRARRQLEEEGWYDRNGDGIIDKMIDGKLTDFRFNLTYYVKDSTGKSICEYVSTALKEVGISCNLKGVDVADLSAEFDQKSFDALYLGWALSTPPEDPKQLWYSAGQTQTGSSNAIGFSNSEADSIIDALEYESNPEKRTALYHRFDAILYDEAPYTFLYSPKAVFLYREYLQNVFLPAERQDLIPGANVAEPDSSIFWLHVPQSS